MTKQDLLDRLYPEDRRTFTVDYALPQNVVDWVVARYCEGLPENRSKTHEALVSGCVYAYSRVEGDRCEGFLPLTKAAREILYGTHVIFIPVAL